MVFRNRHVNVCWRCFLKSWQTLSKKFGSRTKQERYKNWASLKKRYRPTGQKTQQIPNILKQTPFLQKTQSSSAGEVFCKNLQFLSMRRKRKFIQITKGYNQYNIQLDSVTISWRLSTVRCSRNFWTTSTITDIFMTYNISAWKSNVTTSSTYQKKMQKNSRKW